MKCKPKDYGTVEKVRVHIDRLDREDGAVWGVSMSGNGTRAYTRAHAVEFVYMGRTVFRPGERQPKAWIELCRPVVRRVVHPGMGPKGGDLVVVTVS